LLATVLFERPLSSAPPRSLSLPELRLEVLPGLYRKRGGHVNLHKGEGTVQREVAQKGIAPPLLGSYAALLYLQHPSGHLTGQTAHKDGRVALIVQLDIS
jgi:hypothetical protein